MRCLGLVLLCLLAVVGCSRAPAVDTSTPDGAVASTLHALGEGRADVLWKAISPKRQDEVKKLVAETAREIDPEIWERTIKLLAKAGKVAREQKTLALGSKPFRSTTVQAPTELEASWSHLADALDLLTSSELKSPKDAEKLDPGAFLAGTGAKVLVHLRSVARGLGKADPFRKLQEARVVLIDGDEQHATVRIEYPEEPPIVVAVVKVDGQWLPEDLSSEAWDKTLAGWTKDLQGFVAWQKEHKDAIVAELKQIDQVLDKLLAAKTPKEFDEALDQLPSLRK